MKRQASLRRSGVWQRRRAPLRARGAKTAREADAWWACKQAVSVRDRRCRRCGSHGPVHVHHIAPSDRDRGLHDPARCVAVCPACHDHIHGNPTESYETGWLARAGTEGNLQEHL